MLRMLAAAAVAIGLVLAATATTFAQSIDAGGSAAVLQILDPATLDVSAGGTTQRIRLIGLDVPQSTPGQPPDCLARTALARTQQLTAGATVQVELDPARAGRDSLGRQPAYVQLPDGRNLAEVLLREGLVRAQLADPTFADATQFERAQDAAIADGLGVWQADACQPSGPTPELAAFVTSMLDQTWRASTALNVLHEQAQVAQTYAPALVQPTWSQNTGYALATVRSAGQLLSTASAVSPSDEPLAERLAAVGQDLTAGAERYTAGIQGQDATQVSEADSQLQTTAETLNDAMRELNALAETYGLGD
jgi:endonuclease YncB( thermonuclease family)